MSSIIRWDPFEEVGTLRRAVDRLFDDVLIGEQAGLPAAAWKPAVEMYETNDEVVVRAEMPNVDPSNVDVTVANDALTIKGTDITTAVGDATTAAIAVEKFLKGLREGDGKARK